MSRCPEESMVANTQHFTLALVLPSLSSEYYSYFMAFHRLPFSISHLPCLLHLILSFSLATTACSFPCINMKALSHIKHCSIDRAINCRGLSLHKSLPIACLLTYYKKKSMARPTKKAPIFQSGLLQSVNICVQYVYALFACFEGETGHVMYQTKPLTWILYVIILL